MKQKECAGGIVVHPGRGILVITNQLGKHTFPKGALMPGERPLDGAKREITEESGLRKFKVVSYLGVLLRPGFTAEKTDAPSVMKHIDMYHCISDQIELRPLTEDSVHARWVQPDQLDSLLTWPEEMDFFTAHQETLSLYQENNDGGCSIPISPR